MSLETVLVLLIGALALAGAAVGIAVVVGHSSMRRTRLEANPMHPRLSAEVHAGEEQVLIHLARSLTLPSARDDVAYGQIYIAGSAGMTMRLASRSEIGRGFDAEVRVHRMKRHSVAEYFILRLPGDEALLERITQLDDQIAAALRSLDPAARVDRPGRGPGSGRAAVV